MHVGNDQTSRRFRAGDLLRISEEISSTYGTWNLSLATTELVLLEIDPFRLHAYWHIEHADLFRARTMIGDPCASLVLRVLPGHQDPAAPAHGEIPVKGLTESLYLDVPAPGMPCVVEIGLKLRDDTFHLLVRSNLAYPPREHESPDDVLVPVDTRVRPPSAPGEVRIGESMSGPLTSTVDHGPAPGSSWS